jgi:hypothetical protein
MNTRNIIIGALVLGGAYWYYTKYMKKPTTATDTKPSDVTKPEKEIAPKPQTSSPNIDKPIGQIIGKPANPNSTSVKSSFMDFDGELEFEKDVY